MPSYHDVYLGHRELKEVVDLFCKLANGRLLKVGQKYDWPVQFRYAFDNVGALTILEEYANGAGFTVAVTGFQFEITGTV